MQWKLLFTRESPRQKSQKTFSTVPFFTKKDFRTDTLLRILSKFPEILFSKTPPDPCFVVYFIFLHISVFWILECLSFTHASLKLM